MDENWEPVSDDSNSLYACFSAAAMAAADLGLTSSGGDM